MKTGLYVCVEGADDTRFVENILQPLLVPACYTWIKCIEYAQKQPKNIKKFIAGVDRMPHADYLFFADMDEHAPCITAKKTAIQHKYTVNPSKVVIVRQEIEGWYIAGLPPDAFPSIKSHPNPNTITKEQFNQLQPRNFTSRIDFMQEVLKRYNVRYAQNQNESIRYFINKYLCISLEKIL